MEINIRPHTIYFLIGPSNCGKSTFSVDLADHIENTVIVSSDECRRELLGENLDKMNPRMMPVSQQAFKLLHTKIDLLTQFPINTDVVIVDSTGLDINTQDSIGEIAKKNHYRYEAIIFDYKDSNQYFLNNPSEIQKEVTKKHVQKLRKQVLPKLSKSFHEKTRIKAIGDYTFVKDGAFAQLERCTFKQDKRFIIVGDIHGCFDEFMKGLSKNSVRVTNGIIQPTDIGIITVGDYIDKGPQVRETIEFLYDNMGMVHNITGNHEHYVYLRITGFLKSQEADVHFSSIKMLESDEILKQKFITLYQASFPFININNNYIVTHAPCEASFLCKLDTESLRKQRNYRYTHKNEDEILQDLNNMSRDKPYCGPTHIFGHIQMEKLYKNKKNIGIDLGCVSGGQLCILGTD